MMKIVLLLLVLMIHPRASFGMQVNTIDPKLLLLNPSQKRSRPTSDDGYDKEIHSSAKKIAKFFKFQCSLCAKGNEQFANIEKHVLSKHSTNPEVRIIEFTETGTNLLEARNLGKTYSCTVCNISFKILYSYKGHLKTKKHLSLISRITEETKKDPISPASEQENLDHSKMLSNEEIDALFNAEQFKLSDL